MARTMGSTTNTPVKSPVGTIPAQKAYTKPAQKNPNFKTPSPIEKDRRDTLGRWKGGAPLVTPSPTRGVK